MSTDENIEVTTLKIEELKPYQKRIQVSFNVQSKGEIREISSKRTGESHNLCDLQVADSTASIILTLWDDDIDKLTEGQSYTLTNGYVNVYQRSMRLAKGKFGELTESEEAIEEINTENNKSEEEILEQRPHRRRFNRDRRGGYGGGGYGGGGDRRGGYGGGGDRRNNSGWGRY